MGALQRLLDNCQLSGLIDARTATLLAVSTASAFAAGCLVGSWLEERRASSQAGSKAQEATSDGTKLDLKQAVNGGHANGHANLEPMPSARRHYQPLESFPVTPRRTGSGDSLASLASTATDGGRLKICVIIRTDVPGMDARKAAVMCSRLVLQLYKKLWQRKDPTIHAWDRGGKTIVCLRSSGSGTEDLGRMQQAARGKAVPTHCTKDGSSGERTMLALGPAEAEVLHELTGHLRLL